MLKNSLLVVMYATISASSALAAPKAGPKKPDAIAKAKLQISDMLKDPESARFRDVAQSPTTGAICGLVNARNSYGGYGGFQRFIVAAEITKIEGTDPAAMDYRWSQLCEDAEENSPKPKS